MEHDPDIPSTDPVPFILRLPALEQEELPDDFFPLQLVLQPTGATISVQRRVAVVGRHSECDVRLPLPDVSRKHCQLEFSDGCWQVIDNNSLNGVFLNNERVLQASLETGDLLRIGGFTFAVELPTSQVQRPADPVQSILQTLRYPQQRRKAS